MTPDYEFCKREIYIPGWKLLCVLYKSHTRTEEPHKFYVTEQMVIQSENTGRQLATTADDFILS